VQPNSPLFSTTKCGIGAIRSLTHERLQEEGVEG